MFLWSYFFLNVKLVDYFFLQCLSLQSNSVQERRKRNAAANDLEYLKDFADTISASNSLSESNKASRKKAKMSDSSSKSLQTKSMKSSPLSMSSPSGTFSSSRQDNQIGIFKSPTSSKPKSITIQKFPSLTSPPAQNFVFNLSSDLPGGHSTQQSISKTFSSTEVLPRSHSFNSECDSGIATTTSDVHSVIEPPLHLDYQSQSSESDLGVMYQVSSDGSLEKVNESVNSNKVEQLLTNLLTEFTEMKSTVIDMKSEFTEMKTTFIDVKSRLTTLESTVSSKFHDKHHLVARWLEEGQFDNPPV